MYPPTCIYVSMYLSSYLYRVNSDEADLRGIV